MELYWVNQSFYYSLISRNLFVTNKHRIFLESRNTLDRNEVTHATDGNYLLTLKKQLPGLFEKLKISDRKDLAWQVQCQAQELKVFNTNRLRQAPSDPKLQVNYCHALIKNKVLFCMMYVR